LNNNKESIVLNKDDKAPILFLDVNLGNDELARIVVYEGDKSEDVADNFCQSHCKCSLIPY
jgi:hypothetical protein